MTRPGENRIFELFMSTNAKPLASYNLAHSFLRAHETGFCRGEPLGGVDIDRRSAVLVIVHALGRATVAPTALNIIEDGIQ